MRTKSQYSVLTVKDVNLKIKEKEILCNIRTEAKSGDLLAILGPTGSGKTTLLNVISGRLKADSGEVTLNEQPFNKRLRRRLSFVQQQDVFFSQLTLWETLYFTAQIRLPDSLSYAEKKQKINDIIDRLDMRKCVNTVIGDIFIRGLSGGEKKRASVACELLTDPDILLLDEPTSGLDSSTALSLMQQMKEYANHFNKTIITTIHQPSSQIYHLFNNILLLVNGHEAYHGPGKEVLAYFERIGLVCEQHFNPADFILQIAKSDEVTVRKIITEAEARRDSPICEAVVNKTDKEDMMVGDISERKHVMDSERVEALTVANSDIKVLMNTDEETADVKRSLIELRDTQSSDANRQRWVTSWWTQYKMLSWRSFKQYKGNLLQGYAIVQTLIVATITGAIYWQIEQNINTVRDIMGLLFFSVTYWTFNPAFEAITTFPAERGVITKERSAGSYRLSAYYWAKMTSDIPLAFILPTVMYSMVFGMSGVGGIAQFFMTYPIILLQVLLSQAFGFMVVIIFNDLKAALTTFVSYSLCAFMIGGFFTQNVPSCLTWAKYISSMLYPFGAVTTIILREYPPTLCNETSTEEYTQCLAENTTHIYPEDLLANAGIVLPLPFYIWPVFLLIICFRTIGYYLLRFKRQKIL